MLKTNAKYLVGARGGLAVAVATLVLGTLGCLLSAGCSSERSPAAAACQGCGGTSSKPLPAEPVLRPFSSCPGDKEVEAGTNTWVTVTPSEPLQVPLADVPLVVACGGDAVSGSFQVSDMRLAFIPDRPLPASATCSVTLSSELRTTNGAKLARHSLTFSTANVEGRSFRFDAPQELSLPDAGGGNPRVVAEGDDVLAFWVEGPDAMVAVSRDNGLSFAAPIRVHPPRATGLGHLPVVRLNGGVAHILWRSSPFNETPELYYSRSLDSLTAFDTPKQLTPFEDGLAVAGIALATDAADQVWVAWNQECVGGGMGVPCAEDQQGVFVAFSPDAGETFELPVLLAPGGTSPGLAWVQGGLLGGWLEQQASLKLVDGTADFSPLGEFPERAGPLFLEAFVETRDGHGLIFWRDGQAAVDTQDLLFAKLTDRSGDVDAPRVLFTEDNEVERTCFRMGLGAKDELLTLVGVENHKTGLVQRRLSLSLDQGDSFFAPQVLDLFIPDTPDGRDSSCAGVAMGSDGIVHLVWERQGNGFTPWRIFSARGEPMAPCSF